MNIVEVLEQSHLMVIQALDDLPEKAWDTPGVCGDWSVKDIVAHLAACEQVMADALATLDGKEPTPSLQTFFLDRPTFNAEGVEARKYDTAQQVENAYQEAQLQSAALLARIPAATLQQSGTFSWAGTDESVDDFIHSMFEHTYEHCAQIGRFRSREVDPKEPKI